MPLLRVEAERLSNNTLLSGVVDEIIDRDAMFAMMPFMRVNSKALVYNRENTLPGADWLEPNDIINESAATFTEVTAKLRILAGDVDVDKFLQATHSDTNSQVALQIRQKAKAVNRIFHAQVARGDAAANAKAFDGLPKLVSNSRTFLADTNGAAVTLEMLDKLRDMVTLGADAFVMRQGTWRAIQALLRMMGGTNPTQIMLPNFGFSVPAFDGIPVIINDHLAADETAGTNNETCSIYAVRFNEADGVFGIYGGDNVGMQVENVGTVQNKDAWRFRVKWYASMGIKSTHALARLAGVTNI